MNRLNERRMEDTVYVLDENKLVPMGPKGWKSNDFYVWDSIICAIRQCRQSQPKEAAL
ncbi:MAG: hypothetical protein IJT54_01895 [Candidatus Methanomethylophilaceae archaeon]|nr:hypothetical protein [Candidatus Methanomethylophilaceae archaeon]